MDIFHPLWTLYRLRRPCACNLNLGSRLFVFHRMFYSEPQAKAETLKRLGPGQASYHERPLRPLLHELILLLP